VAYFFALPCTHGRTIQRMNFCAGALETIELSERSCSYNEYFNDVDKDGLGPTDAIIRKSSLASRR